MSRNLVIALAVSLLLHAGFFFGGELLKAHPASKPVAEEMPMVQLVPLPPVEPDREEVVPGGPGEMHDMSDVIPPMQTDTPSIADSPFVQQIQPPALSRPIGIIAIPKNRPGGGAGLGLGNIFDLGSLDKNPEPVFRPLPVYPFELRRAGIEGQVTVEFMVDAAGNVRDPRIVSFSNRGFENAVIEGVLKWKFNPGKKGGVSVTTRRVEQTFPFRLN